MILLTSIVCVSIAWYSLFLFTTELHCHSDTIKNALMSHTPALVHYDEHEHRSLFRVNPTHTILQLKIFTGEPIVCWSMAENSPKHMFYFLKFD